MDFMYKPMVAQSVYKLYFDD